MNEAFSWALEILLDGCLRPSSGFLRASATAPPCQHRNHLGNHVKMQILTEQIWNSL